MDSPYYSESELCGGVVTVIFLKYLPWQAHFLQCSTHFSKTGCRLLITLKFLPQSSLFTVGKAQKSDGARSELNSVFGWKKWISGTPLEDLPYSSDLAPCNFWAFPTMKMSSEARKFEVINGLQHIFEKWVVHCKKCIACKGRYLKKETVTATPQSSDSE
jgi:hypothetical protein